MRNRKEQEEAIKFLELHTNFMGKLDKGRCIRIPEENFTKTKESIKTVLNMLKENSAEIHQKNTELAEKNAEIEKYKQLYNKALDDAVITAHDNMKKDKMIDLYIDELVTNEFDRCCQERCRECEKDKDTLRTCIKQYFERKVEK